MGRIEELWQEITTLLAEERISVAMHGNHEDMIHVVGRQHRAFQAAEFLVAAKTTKHFEPDGKEE